MTVPEITPTDAIVHEFDPRNVDVSKCDHNADPPVCHCVHDWRIGPWGNTTKGIEE